MWKISTLILAVALALPVTAHASSTDGLTITEIQQDDGLYDLAQVIHTVSQQSAADQALVMAAFDDFIDGVEAAGQFVDAAEVHALSQELALQLRADLGDAGAAELLSMDAMAPFRMSITHADASVWAGAVADLELSSILDAAGAEEPEAFTSAEDIGANVGTALGMIMGLEFGAPGVMAGGAIGYAVGGVIGAAIGEVLEEDSSATTATTDNQ